MAKPSIARLRLLTIAGSDSGGGAGIQADLKTFAAFGAYGMSAVTAVTAQNTRGVVAVKVLPARLVAAQIEAVVEDIGVDGAKTGMLATASIVRAVAQALRRHQVKPLVIDPVMVAKAGARLLVPGAVRSLRELLFPLAQLITPNLDEAEALTGRRVRTLRAMEASARRLFEATGVPVLVKGGHLAGEPVDILATGSGVTCFRGRRGPGWATHGAGCTLTAAITALLAAGKPLETAIAEAKGYLEGAIRFAPRLGAGASPPDHLWRGLLSIRGFPASPVGGGRRRSRGPV